MQSTAEAVKSKNNKNSLLRDYRTQFQQLQQQILLENIAELQCHIPVKYFHCWPTNDCFYHEMPSSAAADQPLLEGTFLAPASKTFHLAFLCRTSLGWQSGNSNRYQVKNMEKLPPVTWKIQWNKGDLVKSFFLWTFHYSIMSFLLVWQILQQETSPSEPHKVRSHNEQLAKPMGASFPSHVCCALNPTCVPRGRKVIAEK